MDGSCIAHIFLSKKLKCANTHHSCKYTHRHNLLNFLQLYCPHGFSPTGNWGCLPQGRPAVKNSRYPTYGACWVFWCFHNPSNSEMDYRIFKMRTDVNACVCTWGCTDTSKRVCTESRLWEKNPLLHRGIKPASAA